MGGVIDFFLSVNKISLFAFLGVFGFLVYEVCLLRREHLKKQKPVLPQFNTSTVVDKTVIQQQAVSLSPPKKADIEKHTKSPIFLIILLICMIIFFLGFTIYTVFIGKTVKGTPEITPKVIIQEISSPGLKVFDSNWVEINEKDTKEQLNPGERIYIGISTIEEADIDRARIRVNEKSWNISHITDKLNKEKKLYYKEYIIATGESKLTIDAQLHSKIDGWLGD